MFTLSSPCPTPPPALSYILEKAAIDNDKFVCACAHGELQSHPSCKFIYGSLKVSSLPPSLLPQSQSCELAGMGLLNPLICSSSLLSAAAAASSLQSCPGKRLTWGVGVPAQVMDSLSPAFLGTILDTGLE